MSKLEELINALCPNGVEYKELGEMSNSISSGKNRLRNQNGKYPVYGSTGKIAQSNNYIYNNESILVARVGANAGYVYIVNGQYDVSDNTIILDLKKEYNLKYVFYILKKFRLNQFAKGGGQPLITASQLRAIRIPVPPIEVQREIVRILDNFTELQKCLTDELKLRKKQYEYYKNKILNFGNDVPKYKLTDIFNTRNGYTPSKSNKQFWSINEIPWFRMDDIRENGRILGKAIQGVSKSAIKGKPFPANSIIVSTSATIGEHALIKCESLANQRFTYLMLKDEYKDKYNIMFLFYYCFVLDEYCKRNLNQGNFASVDMRKFNDFEFPLPPLEEQERIVSILDPLENLCNDSNIGLPAEIEARKKQYEYYRDKLLTFKELAE